MEKPVSVESGNICGVIHGSLQVLPGLEPAHPRGQAHTQTRMLLNKGFIMVKFLTLDIISIMLGSYTVWYKLL